MHNQSRDQVDQDRSPSRKVYLRNRLWDYEKVVQQTGNEGECQEEGKRESEATIKVYSRSNEDRRSLQKENWGKKQLEQK